MTVGWLAAPLAGCLVVAVGNAVRLRPDHRLREPAHHGDRARAAPRSARLRLPGRRRPVAGAADIAAWCDALAREVRAGSSLSAGLRSVRAPAGSSLGDLGHRLDRGMPLADALALSPGSADEQAALIVLAACAHHGGPAAQPLDRVAALLRRRAADAAERAVHSAQARLSALVMTVLPGAVLVLLVATSRPVRSIATTPLGAAVVTTGLALNLLGWWWMRRIIAGRSA